jgi:hypothetical protein
VTVGDSFVKKQCRTKALGRITAGALFSLAIAAPVFAQGMTRYYGSTGQYQGYSQNYGGMTQNYGPGGQYEGYTNRFGNMTQQYGPSGQYQGYSQTLPTIPPAQPYRYRPFSNDDDGEQ